MPASTTTSENPTANAWLPVYQFAVKTVIVGAVVTYCLLYIVDYVIADVNDIVDTRVYQLHNQAKQFAAELHDSQFNAKWFWSRVEQSLDHSADPSSDIPPERQEKLLREIRILADRARPFILEAAKAFSPAETKDK
jgi:hypothetical protein